MAYSPSDPWRMGTTMMGEDILATRHLPGLHDQFADGDIDRRQYLTDSLPLVDGPEPAPEEIERMRMSCLGALVRVYEEDGA